MLPSKLLTGQVFIRPRGGRFTPRIVCTLLYSYCMVDSLNYVVVTKDHGQFVIPKTQDLEVVE